MEPAAQEEALRNIHFEHNTPKTIPNLSYLRKDLAQCATRGYALDDEEVVTGARCIGAAILDANGRVAGGISVSGPVARINRDRLPLFARTISAAAAEISRKLGYGDGTTEEHRSGCDEKLPAKMSGLRQPPPDIMPKETRPSL